MHSDGAFESLMCFDSVQIMHNGVFVHGEGHDRD